MLNSFFTFLNTLGRFAISFFRASGDLILFTAQTIANIFKAPFYIGETIRMSIEIGFYSLPVVALTTVFSGMVIAIQTYEAVSKFSAEGAVRSISAAGFSGRRLRRAAEGRRQSEAKQLNRPQSQHIL